MRTMAIGVLATVLLVPCGAAVPAAEAGAALKGRAASGKAAEVAGTKTNPGPPDSAAARAQHLARARAERPRIDARLRRLELAVNTELARCRNARGLARRCECRASLLRLRGELLRERRHVSNIHEVLFVVFRESIRETNEDKKYYLSKLKQMNAMGAALSRGLSDLTDASRRLGRVENPRGAAGGAAEEPLTEARCRHAGYLRARDR